ncbi:unnamed protein product [Paramecium octaurelia]|uniref:Uncharacterized protein n=1 Tax=Paramecium octaurelia TaxID=43137 RepID=A0A8S1YIR2_PAROT|nr:unnamed protein product [Paramecium octaurelia]
MIADVWIQKIYNLSNILLTYTLKINQGYLVRHLHYS